jgi:hypothetical protein
MPERAPFRPSLSVAVSSHAVLSFFPALPRVLRTPEGFLSASVAAAKALSLRRPHQHGKPRRDDQGEQQEEEEDEESSDEGADGEESSSDEDQPQVPQSDGDDNTAETGALLYTRLQSHIASFAKRGLQPEWISGYYDHVPVWLTRKDWAGDVNLLC